MLYVCLKQNLKVGIIKHQYTVTTGNDIASCPSVTSAALSSENSIVRVSVVFVFLDIELVVLMIFYQQVATLAEI